MFKTHCVRNGRQSAFQVWFATASSPLLSDCGLDPITIEPQGRMVGSQKLPRGVCSAAFGRKNFSLGEAAIDKYLGDSDHPSHSIYRHLTLPMATSSLLQAPSMARWQMDWQSLLCVSGSVIWKKGSGGHDRDGWNLATLQASPEALHGVLPANSRE